MQKFAYSGKQHQPAYRIGDAGAAGLSTLNRFKHHFIP